MTRLRTMLQPTARCALLAALLAAPVAQAQSAPAGKGVVVVQATRVPQAVARLIDGMLREKLRAAGSTPISADAVTSMQAMLKLPRRRSAEDWFKLGRSLIADRVLVASLNSATGKIRAEVTLYTLTTEVALSRSATVDAAELLATTGRLADEVLGFTPAATPASAPAPSTASPASQPASAPSVFQPAAPVIAPRAAATPPPAPTPAPAPAPALSPPVAGTSPVVRMPPRRPNPLRPTLAFGLHSYYLFSEARGGPMLDLELAFMRNSYRGGMVFRTYFGDQNSFFLGGRFEGGPRWGRFRLSFGLDAGFIFTPDVGDNVDLVLFSARLVGGMFQWKHLALFINAFSLDLYLVPADQSTTQEVESLGGCTSGVSVAAYF